MASAQSYLIIEETVSVECLQNSQGSYLLWDGEATGVAKVTKGTTTRKLCYELALSKVETGKISVELSSFSKEPLKQFLADDADVQIILEAEGRRISTDWLPFEKDLVILRKEVRHDSFFRSRLGYSKKEVTVTITVAPRHLNPTFQPDNPFQIYKKILDEGIGSNFVIVSCSGAEIKCHKSFLCAHSDVLRAMIESSLTEAVTNKVLMVDMSDETVKAFLAFLYYWDTSEACRDSGIAYELLHAAHKYDIKALEIAMRDVFLKKDISWISVDGAVRLFAFCRNLDNGQELKMRGVQVLKANVDSLEKSEFYKELFKRDPEAAMDLFKCCVAT